jgi:ABC-type transporter Mla subunit MlaD
MRSDSGATTGAPRWVKVFGIVALALVLLFVFLHLNGSGLGAHTPPFNITEHGAQQ